MRLSALLIGTMALGFGPALAQDAPKPDPSHITFTLPKDIQWKRGEGMDQGGIFGDPG